MKNKKRLNASKEIKEYILRLKKKLSRLEKYYDKDEYKRTKSIRNLLHLLIDEDYSKPVITKGAFNSSYIQYESIGGEDKNLSVGEYLDRIKPYSSDIINKYKAQGPWRIHSGNKIIEHKTQSE